MKKHKDFWCGWMIIWGIFIGFFLIVNSLFYFLCTNPECNHRFLATVISIKVCVSLTAIIGIIFHFVDYFTINKMDNKSVRMKFNNFKDAYYVNSDRWYMKNKRLEYRYSENWYTICYYVTFSYFDWLKFLYWRINHEHYKRIECKIKKERECDERMMNMLKYIQKDINMAYEKIASMKVE